MVSQQDDSPKASYDPMQQFAELTGDVRVLPAGAETTYRSSSNLLFGLLSEPDQLEAVRANRGLMPQAIEEALRWETPLLTVARSVTEDVELGGVRIPVRSFVAVSLGAANRDPGGMPIRMSLTSSGLSRSTSRSGTGRTSAWGCTWRGWKCKCC